MRKAIASGLQLMTNEAGVWLIFTDSEKGQAALNMTAYAQERGHVVGKVIEKWCEDIQSELTVTP